MMKLVTFTLLLISVNIVAINGISDQSNVTGIVSPITTCGGSWFPIEVRFSNCEGAPPCVVQPFTEAAVEVQLTVRDNIPFIRYILELQTYLGSIVLADAELEVVYLAAYNIRQGLIISNALSGTSATLFINIYDVVNGSMVICAELPIIIT